MAHRAARVVWVVGGGWWRTALWGAGIVRSLVLLSVPLDAATICTCILTWLWGGPPIPDGVAHPSCTRRTRARAQAFAVASQVEKKVVLIGVTTAWSGQNTHVIQCLQMTVQPLAVTWGGQWHTPLATPTSPRGSDRRAAESPGAAGDSVILAVTTADMTVEVFGCSDLLASEGARTLSNPLHRLYSIPLIYSPSDLALAWRPATATFFMG